jgi:hypothetical protein
LYAFAASFVRMVSRWFDSVSVMTVAIAMPKTIIIPMTIGNA